MTLKINLEIPGNPITKFIFPQASATASFQTNRSRTQAPQPNEPVDPHFHPQKHGLQNSSFRIPHSKFRTSKRAGANQSHTGRSAERYFAEQAVLADSRGFLPQATGYPTIVPSYIGVLT